MTDFEHPGFRLQSVPEPPENLSDGARAEWPALASTVYQIGTCRPCDVRALELLAELLADIRGLEAAIRKDGYTLEAGSGGRKGHGALPALASARRHSEQLLGRFGLLPSGKRAEKFSEQRAAAIYG